MAESLDRRFGDEVTVTGELAPEDTNGHFEVALRGQVIHSKNKGMGFVDSREKLGSIIKAIEADME